jgi:hypothetical protein
MSEHSPSFHALCYSVEPEAAVLGLLMAASTGKPTTVALRKPGCEANKSGNKSYNSADSYMLPV